MSSIQLNDESDQSTETRDVGCRDSQAESSEEQHDGHAGEGHEEQETTAISINHKHGGQGEDEVDRAEADGSCKSLDVAEAGLGEDGRGVVGDDVDTAELLHEHDDVGGESSAAVTGYGEELEEASEEVPALGDDFLLGFEQDVDV